MATDRVWSAPEEARARASIAVSEPRAYVIDREAEPIVLAAGEGERMVAYGGHRVLLAESSASVASAAFASAIESGVRCGDGWVFVARDGLVAYADDFLGEPRELGSLPEDRELRVFEGTIAFIDDGAIRTGPCAGPLRTVSAPERVVDAVMSATRGYAVLLGGRSASTSDEGRTWQVQSHGRHAALGFEVHGSEVHVVTSAAAEFDGRRSAQRSELEPDDRDRVLEAVWAHDAAPLRARVARREAAEIDGNVFLLDRGELVRVGPDRRVSRQQVELPEHCTVFAWDGALAAKCTEYESVGRPDLEPNEVFLARDLTSFVRIDTRSSQLSPAEKGRYLGGRCEGSEGVCLLDVESNERFETPWHGDRRSYGWFGTRAIVSSGAQLPSDLFLLEARRSDVARVPVSGVAFEHAAWTEDGLVFGVGVSRSTANRHAMVLWEPGAADAVVRLLPEGADGAGFLDRLRGVATGATGALWRTIDGGQRWNEIEVPIRGDARAVREASREWGPVVCRAHACAAGNVLVDWGTAEAPAFARLAAARPRAERFAGSARLGSLDTLPTTELDCWEQDTQLPAMDAASPDASDVRARIEERNGAAHSIAWASAGAPRQERAALGFPSRVPAASLRVHPIAVAESGLFFALCGDGQFGSVCRHFWSSSGTTTDVFALASIRPGSELIDIVRSGDGLAVAYRRSNMHVVDVVLLARGRSESAVSWRSVHGDDALSSARLASTGEGPAVLFDLQYGELVAVVPLLDDGVGPSRTIVMPTFSSRLPVCDGTDRSALTVRTSSGVALFSPHALWVDLRESGACIRSIDRPTFDADYGDDGPKYRLHAVSGVLEGTMLLRGERRAVRCSVGEER